MGRNRLVKAVATKDSVANLHALAELQGEVLILVASEAHAYRVRNQCYAFRSKHRKTSKALLGIEASQYDGYDYSYGPNEDEEGRWWFRIAYDTIIEFELVVPDHMEDSEIPALDMVDEEHPLSSFVGAEEEDISGTFEPERD